MIKCFEVGTHQSVCFFFVLMVGYVKKCHPKGIIKKHLLQFNDEEISFKFGFVFFEVKRHHQENNRGKILFTSKLEQTYIVEFKKNC